MRVEIPQVELPRRCRSGSHWQDILFYGKCHTCNKGIAPTDENYANLEEARNDNITRHREL